MTTREKLHQLIDQLPENRLQPVLVLLEDLQADRDPLLRSLEEAPEEDPLPDELEAIAEYRANPQPGRPWEEVKRDLDL